MRALRRAASRSSALRAGSISTLSPKSIPSPPIPSPLLPLRPSELKRSVSPFPPVSSGSKRSSTGGVPRSEEHTSELQSRGHLVCRLLLEKKKVQEVAEAEEM